jgi:hypothetical protein
MASSRSAGPNTGVLVPITVTLSGVSASQIILIPMSANYRVGRITAGSGAVATDTWTVAVGNESSATAFCTAQTLAIGASNILDIASADTSEKTVTSGTSYIIITLIKNTTGTIVNPVITVWVWYTKAPEAIARRPNMGSLNQT